MRFINLLFDQVDSTDVDREFHKSGDVDSELSLQYVEMTRKVMRYAATCYAREATKV